MQVAMIDLHECMPGANRYPKILPETPIAETPYAQGETPCNTLVDYEVYPEMTFHFYDVSYEELMHKVEPFDYDLIEREDAYGAEVKLYVQPELKKLIEWEVDRHTNQLELRLLQEHSAYNSKCVELAKYKQTVNQMKYWLLGLSAVASTLAIATTTVVTMLLSK
ncbi:UNVERIFIED_ORG: hypothetical protein GCAPEGMB_00397 [Vibrio phage V07]